MYGVLLDMHYFIRILKNYKMDEDQELKRLEEEETSDKIIIYNEIIEVLKSIYFIFRQKEKELVKKQGGALLNQAMGFKSSMNIDDALDLI